MLVLLAALVLAVGEPPGDDAAASLDGLQQMYDQSCASREYGAFDDLCDQLSHQLRDTRAQAARDARRHAADKRAKATPAAVKGQTATSAAPSSKAPQPTAPLPR